MHCYRKNLISSNAWARGSMSGVDYVTVKNEFEDAEHYGSRSKTSSHQEIVFSEKFRVTKCTLYWKLFKLACGGN